MFRMRRTNNPSQFKVKKSVQNSWKTGDAGVYCVGKLRRLTAFFISFGLGIRKKKEE